MNLDFGTLCLLGIFLIVGVLLFSRMFGGRSGGGTYGTDFSQRGPERRTVDNPEVESHGAFGAPPSSSNRGFSRRFGGRGGFGGGGASIFGGSRRSGGGRIDSPEVKSRGGFGRSKR